MLISGQTEPSGSLSGNGGVSIVHGQPDLPDGGGGSSAIVGQRINSKAETSLNSKTLKN
jgi:hypothetical protein